MPYIKTDFGSGLISHWKLEETSGTRVDQSNNHNDLTDNNTVTYGAGILGNAASFAKANVESLSITDASQTGLDLTSDCTFSVWLKFATLPTGGSQYFIFCKDALTPQRSFGCLVGDNSGSQVLQYYNSSGGDNGTTTSNRSSNNMSLSIGTWYHFVWVYTASAGTVDFYKDGSSIGQGTSLNTSQFNSNATFFVGVGYTGSSFPYDGMMDEITIWSRALTPAEVNTLYNSGTPLEWDEPPSIGIGSVSPRSRRPINTSKFTKGHIPTLLHRSTPAHVLAVDGGLTAPTLSATWSTVSPSVSGSGVVTASEQTATWSIVPYGVVIGGNLIVPVSTVSASWSIPALTGIINDMNFSVNTLSAKWTTEPRALDGVFWTNKYNASDSFWSNKY
jgi:hypothetical protein